MGKVKAMAMDMEEMFFDAAGDVIHECDHFSEFVDVMKPQMDLVSHMSPQDVDCILSEMWNEFWSDYV